MVVMPAVDIAVKAAKLPKKADRGGVPDPAPGRDHVPRGGDMHRHVFTGRRAERGWMDKADMRGVHQVFGDVEVDGF